MFVTNPPTIRIKMDTNIRQDKNSHRSGIDAVDIKPQDIATVAMIAYFGQGIKNAIRKFKNKFLPKRILLSVISRCKPKFLKSSYLKYPTMLALLYASQRVRAFLGN